MLEVCDVEGEISVGSLARSNNSILGAGVVSATVRRENGGQFVAIFQQIPNQWNRGIVEWEFEIGACLFELQVQDFNEVQACLCL